MIYAYFNRAIGRCRAGRRARGRFAGLGVEPAGWVRSRWPGDGMIGEVLISTGFGEMGVVWYSGSAAWTELGFGGERRRGRRFVPVVRGWSGVVPGVALGDRV